MRRRMRRIGGRNAAADAAAADAACANAYQTIGGRVMQCGIRGASWPVRVMRRCCAGNSTAVRRLVVVMMVR